MNTTLCFSIIWILPMATLLTGCAGSTATSISFENYTDDSIPTRLLHEEPSSTEGIQGSLQEIDAKPGASPPNERTPPINQSIAISESAAEERNFFETQATLIINKLHAELLKSKPHLITSDAVWAELKEFVQTDNQKKQEYEMIEVLLDLAKHTPLAQESTSAMIHTETETAQVLSNKAATSTIQELWMEFRKENKIPKLLDAKSDRISLRRNFVTFVRRDPRKQRLYQNWLKWRETNFGTKTIDFTFNIFNIPTEEEADQIMSTLWRSFLKQNKLPRTAPTIDLLDSYLQDLLKPKFFEFVRATHQRSELWMQWLNFKANTEEALAKEKLTPAVVQEMTETKNVLSDARAQVIIQRLWTDFEPLLDVVRKRPGVRKEFEVIFLTFVALDPVRQAIFDEWRKWRITNFGTNGPEFMMEMVHIPTEQEAHEIEETLWRDFDPQAAILLGITTLDHLQPDQRQSLRELLRPSFLAFIGGNSKRLVKWMQTLNVKADETKVVDSIQFTSSLEEKVIVGLHRSILWSNFRQTWPPESPLDPPLPLAFDRLRPDLKRKVDIPFQKFALKDKERRKQLLVASAKITQITEPTITQPKTTQPAGSRKRQRHSSNPPS